MKKWHRINVTTVTRGVIIWRRRGVNGIRRRNDGASNRGKTRGGVTNNDAAALSQQHNDGA